MEEEERSMQPNNRRRLFDDSSSSDAYPSLDQQTAKRPKVVVLRDPTNRVQAPIGVNLDGSDEEYDVPSYDENAEMDPDFLKNKKAIDDYKKTLEDGHENEQLYQMFLIAEQKARCLKVAEMAGKEGSPQDKQNAKILAMKEGGNPLPDYMIDADSDFLNYIPYKPPSITNVDHHLGPPGKADSFCFACSRGVGFPFINGTLVEELEKYIREIIPNCEEIRAAVKIATFYEREIRAVVNVKLNPKERPLPSWTARAVYDCLHHHRSESSLWLHFTLKKLEEDEQILRENGLYVVDQQVISSGRVPTQRDLRPRQREHRMWLDNIKTQAMLRKLNPVKMFGHNDKLSIASTIGRAIGPKENTFGQLKITSLFGTKT